MNQNNTFVKSELNQTDAGLLAVANPTTRFKSGRQDNAPISRNLIPMKVKTNDKFTFRGK